MRKGLKFIRRSLFPLVARTIPPFALFAVVVLFVTLASIADAQQFVPHIGYVYPAGGQQGATFQIVVGGQYLNGVHHASVSGQGVQLSVVEYNRPMTQKEFTDLRDELRMLQEKRRPGRRAQNSTNLWTSADEKRVAEIRTQILKNAPNRQGNPAIAETVTLQVTVATEAEPGEREIRLRAGNGLSNPLMFCVGHLPEFAGPAGKAANPDVDRFKSRLGLEPKGGPTKLERRITLPVVVNGQIMPGAVDRFRFRAQKGEQLVGIVSARQLIPYLADAVPGWFQATLALYDAKGKELVYNDDYRFHPDPVLHCEIPKDGEYVIEIKDALYRGREDFVYRLAFGELPFLTSIFPLGGQAGTRNEIELKGWNLTTNRLTIQAEKDGPAMLPISLRNEGRISNYLPFAVDTLPECLEHEGNDSPADAQKVTLPIIINGRIGRPGDSDVFRFEGRAGQEIVAEVSARRLDSPLDSVLKLTDATGQQLAFNDDQEDKACGLNTHHADSYVRATLRTDGTYYVHLGDTQHKGGDDYAYRLRISEPRPDFELRVVPSSINARAGVSVPLTVYAIRKDGFAGEIALALNEAPDGFKLSGARLPAKQDEVRLTIAVLATLDAPVRLILEGHAIIHGLEVSRPGVPAEDMLQAFAYHHLVPAKELQMAASGRFPSKSSVKILGDVPVKIPAGGSARVQIAGRSSAMADNFKFELSEPPPGITLRSTSPTADGIEMVFQGDPEKAKAGLQGNLIVNVLAGRNLTLPKKPNTRANQRRAPIGTLPAIPFEIVEHRLTRTSP